MFQEIPLYSLDKFLKSNDVSKLCQVEVFDAHRHFEVQYPHRHDFYEILYINKGTGVHVIDDHQFDIKSNCIFFLSPGQIHSIELSNDVEGFIFLFRPEFYLYNKTDKNKLLEYPFFHTVTQIEQPLLISNKEDQTFFNWLFDNSCKEAKANNNHSPQYLMNFLDLILLKSSQLFTSGDSLSDSKKGYLLVKKFKLLIEENYKLNYSISQYAEQLGVTANHLSEMVKAITGRTSTDLVNEKKVLEIKRLLMFTDLSVTEISEELNFSDQSYFAKYFKKIVGLSPKQYRESVK